MPRKPAATPPTNIQHGFRLKLDASGKPHYGFIKRGRFYHTEAWMGRVLALEALEDMDGPKWEVERIK
jgi:hypothetical protein